MKRALLAIAATVLWGADPPPQPVSVKTADVEITARLIADRDAQLKAVGSDMNRQYVIVELTVVPRGGYPVTLNRDDFLLRSERDNERGTADSPERIAGSAVLVLGPTGGGRGIFSESGDPIYVGGIPGTGGQPRRIGTQDGAIGGGASPSSSITNPSTAKSTPLLDSLKSKELPLGETGKRVSGFLYFPVDPKQKTKNFWLHYKGPTEKGELRFK